ncbi:MAG: Quinolinate phosphoribosyltransferase [decarboxylating] [Ktedonobacterales bacterium]|jgi:nicotinate-nucleotide pyrophosphorylase (carboxylating)|nr:MAG: Quinolinate phosphoribosyltransferase [decarboxylating] [Ktedonobacterales bacterium]
MPTPDISRESNHAAFDPVFDVELVRRALAEDIGRGDVTTEATIAAGTPASARIVTREAGVVAGLPVAALAFRLLDPPVRFEPLVADGARVEAGAILARVAGDARALLTVERTALNFLGRLSGIATLAARCQAAVTGTRAAVVDTRKTTPGLRTLEKYAVRMGGARNHRAGLDDGILIKDNHIAAAGGVREAVARARAHASHLLKIEVECDNEAQVSEAVEAGADVILLDNMPPSRLRENVIWIREHAPRTLIEASGNIGADPERLAAVAATGVDLISLGALTHSAPNFDVSLEFDS